MKMDRVSLQPTVGVWNFQGENPGLDLEDLVIMPLQLRIWIKSFHISQTHTGYTN